MAPRIANSVECRLGGVLFGVALLVPRVALGETPTDSARAQELFDEARILMKAERYAEACPMLAESQALDPGGGTILNLGICHARQGRTATAWSELHQALARAEADGRTDRIKTARKHLDALAPILSRLRVELAAGAELPGLTIEIDGTLVTPSAPGAPAPSAAGATREWDLPVDPGTHEVKALAPGRRAWSIRVTIAPVADRQSVQIPVLPLEAPAEPPGAPVRATPAPQREVPPEPAAAPPPAKAAPASPARWVGFTALGVGAASLGVGTYFAIRSFTLKGDSNRDWDGEYCARRSCVDAWEDAKTAARAADISVALGLVAIGAGAYLVLRPAPSSAASAVRLSIAGTRSGGALRASAEF